MKCDVQEKIEDEMLLKHLINKDLYINEGKLKDVIKYHSSKVLEMKKKYNFDGDRLFDIMDFYSTRKRQFIKFDEPSIMSLQNNKDRLREMDRQEAEMEYYESMARKDYLNNKIDGNYEVVDGEIIILEDLPNIKLTC